MKTERVSLADVPEATLARLAGRSFFASRGFLELWRWKGGTPVAWCVETGGAVAGLLPGVEYGRGPLARFCSMPDGCYGGILADGAVARDRSALARELFAALARRRYAKAHVFDFHGSAPCHPGFAELACETTLVDIGDPAWQPPDRKLQSQIRKARREGCRHQRFDWDRHHARFLALADLAAFRHGGGRRYPPEFFRALADLARRDERVHWAWCEHDGRAVCSHIYFVEDGVLQAWQSYLDRRFSFLKPNQLIRFEVCGEMRRRGVTRLNLGATPQGATGLAYFKARWGGERVRYASYLRRDGLGLLVAGARARATPAAGTRELARDGARG